MEHTLENPVQAPGLSDERLADMRGHLLVEIDRASRKRGSWTGRRRLLVALAAAFAVIYALPAVAEDRVLWWVHGPNDPFQPATHVLTFGRWTDEQLRIYPSRGPVPTSPFTASGARWVLQAFVDKEGDLCVGLSLDVHERGDSEATLACGQPVYGTPIRSGVVHDEMHWAGFTTSIPGRRDLANVKLMYGVAAGGVRYVDLENNDGEVIRVPTIDQPQGLDADARFWVVELPVDHIVNTLVPRDNHGKALEHWHLAIAQ
jgi:hypothetical protein